MSKFDESYFNKTLYILGAGASRDSGIPLTSEILRVGYELIQDSSKRLAERFAKMDIKEESPTLKLSPILDSSNFLDYLNPIEISKLEKVYNFLRDVLGWNGDPDYLPEIEELWGILEIANQS